MSNLVLPMSVISYYASSKGIDGKNSYDFWMRSKLIRIISNKPFARGDVLEIFSIETTSSGIVFNVTVEDKWDSKYPVLVMVSGRVIYNENSNFKWETSEGITVIEPIVQILTNNYSIGFVVLAYNSGIISCRDDVNKNNFNIHLTLDYED